MLETPPPGKRQIADLLRELREATVAELRAALPVLPFQPIVRGSSTAPAR
jgi:hypothetical protein